MNVRRLGIIAVAIAINVLVLAWFHAWSASVIASAAASPSQHPAVTLPVVDMHSSAAQLHAVERGHAADALPVTVAKCT